MLKREDEPTSPGPLCAIIAIVCGLLGIGPAMATGFAVKPLRVHLYQGHMTESIVVSNDEAVALSMQIRAYAWSQDEEGQDIYEATDELIFFPKLLVLNPGEKRMVRVGVRGAPPESEKAYRI
jgi:fimbrial chaperone protein